MAFCSESPAEAAALEQLQVIYQAYYDASWALQGYRPPDTKLFGIGSAPKNDPCHKQFAADVAAFLNALVQQPVSEAAAAAVLRYMLEEPERKQEDQLVYWMLLAVHGSAAPLCSLLSASDAASLCLLYDRLYPRRLRSPVQKQFYKVLRARSQEH